MNVADIGVLAVGLLCLWAIWTITKWIIKILFLLILAGVGAWYFGLLPV